MSLLVVNSANRIAQGLIKQLHKSGKYDTIICADLYPNYWGIQKQVEFLHSFDKSSKTKLVDAHISDKQDLEKLIALQASHVLYVNHDYFTSVAAKTNLIQTTAQLVQNYSNVKGFVAVNPSEHNHMGEKSPFVDASQSQRSAQQTCHKLVNIQSDLAFGADATVLKLLTGHLLHNQNITFQPSSNRPAPIHTNCVAHGVQKVLEQGDKLEGQSFIAEGPNRYSWNQILSILERATGAHAVQGSQLEYFVSPLKNNLLSEFLYRDFHRNAIQFVNQYQPCVYDGAKPITELGVKPLDFEAYYKDKKIPRVESNERADQSETTIKAFLY